jgi:hypothetical protein
MVDDTLLHAIRGGGTYKGLGGIDEFGQTMRAVSGEVSSQSKFQGIKADKRRHT